MATTNADLHYLTISQAGALLQRQELSPVELTRAFLDRIEATNDQLHSFITILAEEALADARVAEAEILQGHYKGPMHGIPFALKDLYDTAGIRTTSGSRVDIDRVPTEDATTTARLKNAGGICWESWPCTSMPWVDRISPLPSLRREIPGIWPISPVAPAAAPAPRWPPVSAWVPWVPAPGLYPRTRLPVRHRRD